MTRAKPLPPDERRAAIIAATKPLLKEHGTAFTTRQVAQAAGIAEGTIFRVFDSKDDLLWAVIDGLLDPSETCEHIRRIPASDDLDAVVGTIIAILQDAIREISAIFGALHTRMPRPSEDAPPSHGRMPTLQSQHDRAEALVDAVVHALAPFREHLQPSLPDMASLIRSMAFATAHPFFTDQRLTDPEILATVLLHGAVRPTQPE